MYIVFAFSLHKHHIPGTSVQETMQKATLTMIYSQLGDKHTLQATRTLERIPQIAPRDKLCEMFILL